MPAALRSETGGGGGRGDDEDEDVPKDSSALDRSHAPSATLAATAKAGLPAPPPAHAHTQGTCGASSRDGEPMAGGNQLMSGEWARAPARPRTAVRWLAEPRLSVHTRTYPLLTREEPTLPGVGGS